MDNTGFINWTMEKLTDLQYFDYVVREVTLMQQDYYSPAKRKLFLCDKQASTMPVDDKKTAI